ncbi:MAG: AsnC family transcriptional regulator [Candidatus Omnitrophica bacterium CG11_big_fil_rev_8_21_14_0_20_42_13]|uniref:AsnC family transcriptional regulator n=1 Tax=Candidatus Ghiorseimicrobium undicola TaxID=1974746 RepID=A0A2H0LXZ4_9BACT|nr:MAG: AsnC family transcriptional regulator [Candidatus Omnitrophica bacterium CG11_big_fil_rev_8_21_14_0_20_42_13]
MDEILELLENNARLEPEEIAKILKKDVKSVKSAIKKYEKDGVILKYRALINKELVRDEENYVRALIEVNLVPQKDLGFDHIAERIYQFPEVASCYLISGTYDLLLVVEGKNIHTVSNFVSEKLAPMENVRGTVTHFLLKKYKEDGVILKHKEENKRINISY